MNFRSAICVATLLTLLFTSSGSAAVLQYVGHNTNLDGTFNDDYVNNTQTPTATINFANAAGIETNTASTSDMLTRVSNQIFSALDPWSLYGSTAWDGPGYTSSVAKANPTKNTTIGINTGAQFLNTFGAGTQFFGATVTSNEILMRYTYVGDFNLDGFVDTSDISNLLYGLSHNGDASTQVYLYGDSNYDQFVDASDISNLLYGLSSQATEALAYTPPYTDNWPTAGGGIKAVPEPSTIVLLVLACAFGLAARKKF